LSEDVKRHFSRAGLTDANPNPGDPSDTQLDSAEAQMRRALGLNSDSLRPRFEPERNDPPQRNSDRSLLGHRRRFVQDGDVPVTVVRRDQGGEAPGALAAGPSSNRLQRAEAALASQTAARERAERQVSEMQDQVRDLQTKLGHAELARAEAVEAARRTQEAASELRQSAQEGDRQRREIEERALAAERRSAELEDSLDEERAARVALDKKLREAQDARQAAERLVEELSERNAAPEAAPAKRGTTGGVRFAAHPAPSRKPRQAQASLALAEPEPVKWWLTAEPTTKRR